MEFTDKIAQLAREMGHYDSGVGFEFRSQLTDICNVKIYFFSACSFPEIHSINPIDNLIYH